MSLAGGYPRNTAVSTMKEKWSHENREKLRKNGSFPVLYGEEKDHV
jgi:hypothetical protein